MSVSLARLARHRALVAMQRLDATPDAAFAAYRLDAAAVVELRRRFADWDR